MEVLIGPQEPLLKAIHVQKFKNSKKIEIFLQKHVFYMCMNWKYMYMKKMYVESFKSIINLSHM